MYNNDLKYINMQYKFKLNSEKNKIYFWGICDIFFNKLLGYNSHTNMPTANGLDIDDVI